MPRIAHRATFSATSDNFTLNLAVQHLVNSNLLQYDEIAKTPPSNVLAQNPLLFTLSGSRDGVLATHDELVTSRTTNHLVEWLRRNVLKLGLDSVSEIVVHQDSDIPGFTVTFGHAKNTTEFIPARPVLQSLHLDFAWKTQKTTKDNAPSPDLASHPFSEHLTLPLQTLLNEVVTRFVKNSLVKRYPFIFGDLARQLINETAYFTPIITAITNIIKRSPHLTFRSQCGELLKLLRHRRDHLHATADQQLETRRCQTSTQRLTTAAFVLAMQTVIKTGMKCTAFKGTYGYIMDIEEQELLEPEPRLMDMPEDRVSHLPLEDLFLDQDEDLTELLGRQGLLPSGPLENSRLAIWPPYISCSARIEIPMDIDSGSESDSFKLDDPYLTPLIDTHELALDLGGSDEDELGTDTVEQLSSESGTEISNESHCYPLFWQYCSEISLGSNGSFSFQADDGIYVEATTGPMTQGADKEPDSVHTNGPLNLMTSHATHQQARSVDKEFSRGKGNRGHMDYLALWRAKAASRITLGMPTRAPLSRGLDITSIPLGEEDGLPLDTDSDLEEGIGLWTPRPEEARGAVLTGHELNINLTSDAPNHKCDHAEFFDVLSEDFCLDNRHSARNQDNDYGTAPILNSPDNKRDRDAVAGFRTYGKEVVSRTIFSELLDDEMALGGGFGQDLTLWDETTPLPENREELDNWSDDGDECLCMELIT